MNALNAALLVNLLGFAVGIALYALLGAMVVRHHRESASRAVIYLLLTTAALGSLWNIGELYAFVQKDFSAGAVPPFLIAISFSALGFLPSVVVHSARADEGRARWLTYAAYVLSTFAAVLHLRAAAVGADVPSDLALQTLTYGSLALVGLLLIFNLKQTLEKKAIWATALLIFAVSALHLSGEREGSSWFVELIAHQSSLPLALAILYQNYRFAFADLFLKRAISLILLTGLAFGMYVLVAVPMLRLHEAHDKDDVQAIAGLLAMWIATALIYPLLHRFAVWLVDNIILQRADYARLRQELAFEIESCDSVESVLNVVNSRLSRALTAKRAEWTETDKIDSKRGVETVTYSPSDAVIAIPTAELPHYEINLGEFHGGRRLLSDELAVLQAVAFLAARRIDVLRVTQERFEQKFREHEFAKLAAEAQLTALRSQINPHFLFNTLTTIGYLIKTSPDKAFDTLLRLTQLLRGVLSKTSEFTTLGEEMKLIENYLDIEHARFEERLSVKINVPAELENVKVPALILQPLVENAIKHGISENKNGGEVRITASMEKDKDDSSLRLSVWNSGAGIKSLTTDGKRGVGLRNVRERLESYYGRKAEIVMKKAGNGTEAALSLPVSESPRSSEYKL